MAAALLGIDPLPFLHADRLEAQALNEIVSQALKHREHQLDIMTTLIANKVGKVFGG